MHYMYIHIYIHISICVTFGEQLRILVASTVSGMKKVHADLCDFWGAACDLGGITCDSERQRSMRQNTLEHLENIGK